MLAGGRRSALGSRAFERKRHAGVGAIMGVVPWNFLKSVAERSGVDPVGFPFRDNPVPRQVRDLSEKHQWRTYREWTPPPD